MIATTRCIVGCSVLIVPFVLAAAPPPLDGPPFDGTAPLSSFSELDRNGDGVLSQDELPAAHPLRNEFDRFDDDGDRTIDRDEFDRYLAGADDPSEQLDYEDEYDDDKQGGRAGGFTAEGTAPAGTVGADMRFSAR